MGVDFRSRVAKSLHKGWDRGVDPLRGVDLFTTVPNWLHDRAMFRPLCDVSVEVGASLVIQLHGNEVCAFDRFQQVAVAEDSGHLRPFLMNSPGHAALGLVESVFTVSGLIELSIQVPV